MTPKIDVSVQTFIRTRIFDCEKRLAARRLRQEKTYWMISSQVSVAKTAPSFQGLLKSLQNMNDAQDRYIFILIFVSPRDVCKTSPKVDNISELLKWQPSHMHKTCKGTSCKKVLISYFIFFCELFNTIVHWSLADHSSSPDLPRFHAIFNAQFGHLFIVIGVFSGARLFFACHTAGNCGDLCNKFLTCVR